MQSLNSCQVTGIQHLELARLLLTDYNPRVPRLGPDRYTTQQDIEAEIKTIVLRMCGIAFFNRLVPPVLLTTAVAVTLCGDRFSDPAEQQALIGVLLELEEEHAWPTQPIQDQLEKCWGRLIV